MSQPEDDPVISPSTPTTPQPESSVAALSQSLISDSTGSDRAAARITSAPEIIDDINVYHQRLAQWHQDKTLRLEALLEIPDDATITWQGVEYPVRGDLKQGFLMGLQLALAHFGKLPFRGIVETPEHANAGRRTQ